MFSEDDAAYREPLTIQRKALGIVLIIVVILTASIVIYLGAVVVGGFFSAFVPLTAGLPATPAAIMASIPTSTFIALDIFVAGVALIAVIGILKIIFGM